MNKQDRLMEFSESIEVIEKRLHKMKRLEYLLWIDAEHPDDIVLRNLEEQEMKELNREFRYVWRVQE